MRTYWPVFETDPPRVTIYRDCPPQGANSLGRFITIAQAVEAATAELRRHGVKGRVRTWVTVEGTWRVERVGQRTMGPLKLRAFFVEPPVAEGQP